MIENKNIKNTLTPYIKTLLDDKAKELSNPIYVFVGIKESTSKCNCFAKLGIMTEKDLIRCHKF